jgi:PncC family amidohydrolase|uniref:CinA family protein n=1 Tax=Caldisericum exile TaxID=693075 RepID=A0A7C4Y4N4_9BACT
MEEKLVELLKNRRLSIATAESVTGGLIAKSITDIKGSSSVFVGGVVAYSPFAKEHLLSIPKGVIDSVGTVHPEVARLMAVNVKKLLNAEVGVSVTGVAGPDAIEGKPVGLVYMGIAVFDKVFVFEEYFKGTRDIIREEAKKTLLKKLIEIIEGG